MLTPIVKGIIFFLTCMRERAMLSSFFLDRAMKQVFCN